MIPMTRPLLDDTECDAVLRVLRSGMLVQGAEVQRFEQLVAEQSGRAHGDRYQALVMPRPALLDPRRYRLRHR